MLRRLSVLFAAAAMISLPGCWFTGSYWTGDDDDISYDDGWRDPSARAVTFERLDGQLGGHDLSLARTDGTAFAGYGTTLELETIDAGTWMLFRLEVGADLYDPELPDGVLYSAQGGDQVDLMGCTGDAPYEFDYDGYASDVEVQVTQAGPDSRRVDFTASFDDGLASRQVTGTVMIDLNAPTAQPWEETTGSTRSVQWNSVTADLGDEGAYALSSVEGSGYSDGYSSSMEFESTEPGQWVMFRLSTYNADLYSAQVGDVIEDGELLGCTGDTPGNFDYDGYAANVQVQILPGLTDADRIAHIVGSFETEWGTQTIDAEVGYTIY